LKQGAVALFADAEGLFRHTAVGDVAFAALHSDLTAALVEDGSPRGGNPLDTAVAGDHAVLFIVEGVALEQTVPVGEHALAIFGMNPADELLSLKIGSCVSGKGVDGRIDKRKTAVHVVGEH